MGSEMCIRDSDLTVLAMFMFGVLFIAIKYCYLYLFLLAIPYAYEGERFDFPILNRSQWITDHPASQRVPVISYFAEPLYPSGVLVLSQK